MAKVLQKTSVRAPGPGLSTDQCEHRFICDTWGLAEA